MGWTTTQGLGITFDLILMPCSVEQPVSSGVEVPSALARVYDLWAARPGEFDLLAIDSPEPGRELALMQTLLSRPRDPVIGRELDSVLELTYHPRECRDLDGVRNWQQVFADDAPKKLDATEAIVFDAWFRRDLTAEHFLPGNPLGMWHLPVIRLRATFHMSFRKQVIDGLKDVTGHFDGMRLRRWTRTEADLAGLLDWDYCLTIREALPDALPCLHYCRTLLKSEIDIES